MKVIDYVNPLQGTASEFHFSNGNTLPLVSMPFGMNSWCPQTAGDRWFFNPSHRHCQGIRLTHQPSPWIGDYGHLVLMPQAGKLILSAEERSSSFRKDKMVIAPDYLKFFFNKDRVNFELTPTERGACIRLEYEEDINPRLILSSFSGEAYLEIRKEENRIVGYTTANSGGVPDNFAMYFMLEFDCLFNMEKTSIYNAEFQSIEAAQAKGNALGIYVGLQLGKERKVNIKMATSFISMDQAIYNLQNEIGAKSFDEVRSDTRSAWEDMLGRVEVFTHQEEQKKTFYSCLYRNLLFPRIFYEMNGQGEKIHYSPYDGSIYKGPMYTDNGFWDTYRTTYPLFSLLYPSRLSEILEGWVNAYRESGWMPKWVSPGERSCMPGTLIDAVFADAAVKGIKGFDIRTAYEGLKKHAFQISEAEGVGRKGLKDYLEKGYLPYDLYWESVSNTLDYIYGDFCIAQMSKKLGEEEDYRQLIQRAGNYSQIFDKASGFMRGKDASGMYRKDFDPIEWGGAYCEGSAWQCSWAVQHDLRGLAKLMGGKEKLYERLETLMTMEPVFKIGTYPYEIHEMSEMAAVNFGQFAISNQPSFHIPYIYTAIGYPSRTQYWTRKALDELFSGEEDGFPGDEDNGSMSAWYIFSAMGFYPLCPGTDEYVLGSPLFDKIQLYYENGGTLTIQAENNKKDSPYVEEVYFNDKLHSFLYFTHEELQMGGKICFKMSKVPDDKKSYTKEQLPYSLSHDEKE